MPDGERRLAAVMFTDLVGYTALSQKNEGAAMLLLEEHRKTVRPYFSRHGGTEVKTIGDAFLVEFASALEAVRCAYDIQQATHDLNSSKADEDRVVLRVGIHLGDVIHSQNDVYGDAVNVASRIEPLAQAGGISVSRQVYDHVKGKFEFPLVSIGMKELKNVTEPVEVFRMVLPWEKREDQTVSLDRLRIAVLPFSNISPDPADEYFADGMTEELIATMSRMGGLKVIARTSVMGYKGGQKKISDVARELEVGSVLEGSVRKAGDRVRITIQLIDSKTSEHIWAESYERELKDVFAIQSEVSTTVAQALKVHLTPQEKVILERKHTANPEAHTLYLKGRFYWNERTKENTEKALSYFEKAVAVDPSFALAYTGIADCYNILQDYGWMAPKEALILSKKNAEKALELDDTLAEAHASIASTMSLNWDWAGAEREFQRAITLSPSYAPAHHWYALVLINLGKPEEALKHEELGLVMDPYSRTLGLGVAVGLYMLRRFEEARTRLETLVELHPDYSGLAFWKSVVHLALNENDAAVSEIQRAMKLDPSTNVELALAQVYGMVGRREDAIKVIEHVKLRQKDGEHFSFANLGAAELMMGAPDLGYEHLEEGFERREVEVLGYRLDPLFDRFHEDPRWKALDAKILRAISQGTSTA